MVGRPGRRWLWGFARDLWREIQNDHLLDGAAVLGFFFVLAAFPAAIFVLSLLPSLSIPHLHQALLQLLHQVLPAQSADLFDREVRYGSSEGKQELVTFGLAFALWSGSTGIYSMMEQLNVVYDVSDRRPFWKARGIAILLMLFFAVLLIVSLSAVIFGGVVQSWAASIIGWSHALRLFFATLRWVILLAAVFLGIAVAYRFGPDAKVPFRYISAGNVVAVILVALASAGFQVYVSDFGNYGVTYGSMAAVIILMMWAYLVGIALLLGAEVDSLLRQYKSRESASRNNAADD
jgi:membrane protein